MFWIVMEYFKVEVGIEFNWFGNIFDVEVYGKIFKCYVVFLLLNGIRIGWDVDCIKDLLYYLCKIC